MFRYFTNAYPAWYREGFAEYISTTDFDDDGFTIGAPANHRAFSIRQGNYIDFEDIIIPPKDGYGSREFMFYAQSWVLTHYLISDPDRNRSMLQYFGRLASGMDTREAAVASFGDLEKLDREAERYGRGTINFRRSPQQIPIDGDVNVSRLSDLESSLVEARFFNRVAYRPQRTVNRLRELAALHPNNSDIWVELAAAERVLAHENESLDFEKAHQAVDRALAIDPQGESANLFKARLLTEAFDHPELGQEVDWEAQREYAIRANQANPNNALALFTYIESFRQQGTQMPDIALSAMQQVFSTMPEATNVRVLLAQIYAGRGEFDQALNLVSFLVGDPHNSERGRELVADIKALRDGTTATEPTPDIEPSRSEPQDNVEARVAEVS